MKVYDIHLKCFSRCKITKESKFSLRGKYLSPRVMTCLSWSLPIFMEVIWCDRLSWWFQNCNFLWMWCDVMWQMREVEDSRMRGGRCASVNKSVDISVDFISILTLVKCQHQYHHPCQQSTSVSLSSSLSLSSTSLNLIIYTYSPA